eukprot:CAMPEP_0177418308 /NCGR_PEP_ID=MMETSP0368-20130122/69112_1 /TAXON_ID=447022 ORGANISM="Scrippsiella hangoei-like, Strain SHHI-4" /NCGR_SAMPLE_ID=MMETSP0368 /ASSEMBLY_ACC=CAM_ASM_000363 /LENGTH=89 /DNA_ID=CAMNT_0018887943 /DNA_START=238 /DNA_END=507 /DNA_ORIENTATION=-
MNWWQQSCSGTFSARGSTALQRLGDKVELMNVLSLVAVSSKKGPILEQTALSPQTLLAQSPQSSICNTNLCFAMMSSGSGHVDSLSPNG